MRKELFICSVLMAASLLTSCGYDDGKEEVIDELLPVLSSSCTSTVDCKIGTSIVGECISGVCQRYCDSYDDCETNTICESGICRPIIECPSLTFQDTVAIEGTPISNAGASEAYTGKKCIQVFSHAPVASWNALTTKDVVLDSSQVMPDSETDFTSDDFTFVVPHNSVYSGMNFSITTFVSLVYLTMLENTYVDVAECIQPKILKSISETGENIYGLLDNYVYAAPYKVNVSDMSLSDANAMANVCRSSVVGMNYDMEKYLEYYQVGELVENGKNWDDEIILTDEQINKYISLDDGFKKEHECTANEEDENATCFKGQYKVTRGEMLELAVMDYSKMISTDAECVKAINNLNILVKISQILMQIGNADGVASFASNASSELSSLLANMYGTYSSANYYKKIYETTMEVEGLGPVDIVMDLQSITACTEDVFNKSRNQNDNIFRLDQSNYKKNEKYLPYCNRDSMMCSDYNIQKTCTYDDKKGMDVTYDMIINVPMMNLVNPCDFSLLGVSNFPLTKSLTSSDDMKIGVCSDHNNVVAAMIEKSLLSKPTLTMLNIIETVFKSDGENSFINLGPSLIYEKFLDPSYLWLSGDSYMGLQIRVSEHSDFKVNDLILENRFKPIDEMFKMTTIPAVDDDGEPIIDNGVQKEDSDMYPLTTDIRINVFSDAYAKEEIVSGMPSVIPVPPTGEAPSYVSSYDYKKTDVAKTISGTALYQKHGKAETCPKNICTLYHYAHKIDENVSGMICGGFTYDVEQFNGYVVLTDEDLAIRAGKRNVKAESVSK